MGVSPAQQQQSLEDGVVDGRDASDASSDADFDPAGNASAASVSESSDDDDDGNRALSSSRKKSKTSHAPDDELDSGDEATIAKARARRKGKQAKKGSKKKKSREQHSNVVDDDDKEMVDWEEEEEEDGNGAGGFVKTRSQRRTEKQAQRPLARIDGATVDVDLLWNTMTAQPVGRDLERDAAYGGSAATQADNKPDEEMITIKRRTLFAGRVVDEERKVPASSAEARVWLAEQAEKAEKKDARLGAAKADDKAGEGQSKDDAGKDETAAVGTESQSQSQSDAQKAADTKSDGQQQRKPLRRPSRFEPNPTGQVKNLPEHMQVRLRFLVNQPPTLTSSSNPSATAAATSSTSNKGAEKINTVSKSRHDWARFVDSTTGLADELSEYGKAKEGYGDRMAFLQRVEGRRANEVRDARSSNLTNNTTNEKYKES